MQNETLSLSQFEVHSKQQKGSSRGVNLDTGRVGILPVKGKIMRVFLMKSILRRIGWLGCLAWLIRPQFPRIPGFQHLEVKRLNQ